MEESVVNEYAASLSELVTNSKPLISMLTILADENRTHAAKIAQVIQKYLEKSPKKIKLLSLYLIDSIVKNVREPYIEIFAENLVPMFTEVFEGGDEKVRAALFKLRQTWKGIFSESKLYLVDISTKRMDPQWPITTTSENLRAPIHLNPKFFLRQTNGVQEKTSPTSQSISENVGNEKSNKRQTGVEEPHKGDGAQITVLQVNTDSEKRPDPRLKKRDASERKHSSKGSSRHEEGPDKPRPMSKSSSRSSSQKSDHKKSTKRTSEDFSESSSSLEPSLADKEAAAILSGDVDLRLLGPAHKKVKQEPPTAQDFPMADVDLRIRPSSTDAGAATVKVEAVVEEEDVDKSAQWAKVKGSSTNYSTEPVPPKTISSSTHSSHPRGPMTSAPQLPEPIDPLYSDRSMKLHAPMEIGHSSFPKNKNMRVSEPAPDSGQIRLDGRMREVRFVDGVAVAIIDEMPPNFVRARQIMFRGGTRKIIINDIVEVLAAFDGREHDFNLNGNRHRIRFGAPLRELYIDGIPYACQFNGVPIYVRSREDVFSVTLHPPCPSVNDKMEATPELLNKLGFKPLPSNPTAPFIGGNFQGVHPISGHLPLNGANSGGWIRYQDEICAPSSRPPSAIFPPMPANLGPLAPHPAFPGSNLFCPPPHLGGPPYGAYPGPPILPPANLAIAAVPAVIPPVPPVAAAQPQAVPDVKLNVSDLLSKLVNAGIIGSGEKAESSAATDLKSKELVKEEIPKLSFKHTDLLKKRYNGVISALHEGVQCATCGQRFTQAEKNSDKYAQHLDWHFRTARREREGLKKASSRKWYYEVSDWMQYEEVEDVDDRARSYFEIQEAQHDSPGQENETTEGQELPTVSAKLVDQHENTCFLCHEAFELFFCEESEEWRLRNAVMHDGKVFHPNCYEDFIRPAPEPVVPKEEPASEPDEEPLIKSEPSEPETSTVCDDESSQPLPGLDFVPTPAKAVTKVEPEDAAPEQTEPENEGVVKEEQMDTDEAGDGQNDTLQLADQTVIVEELGEFGVHVDSEGVVGGDDESTQNSEFVDAFGVSGVTSPENVSQDSQAESKIIVKSKGGIVLKVNHDSVANGENKTADETIVEAEPEPEVEWTPPAPDPAYESFPPVKKGTEESGLCSIM